MAPLCIRYVCAGGPRLFFFFNDTATTEIYTLSLHDALPISPSPPPTTCCCPPASWCGSARSEEHTSELQSRGHLVCRLLLEKKKNRAMQALIEKKKKDKTNDYKNATNN